MLSRRNARTSRRLPSIAEAQRINSGFPTITATPRGGSTPTIPPEPPPDGVHLENNTIRRITRVESALHTVPRHRGSLFAIYP